MRKLLGLAVLSMLGIASGSLQAQTTTQNGPYYATPSWDQQLPAAQRFIVLSNFNSDAVLDRETGLVWEKVPDSGFRTWSDSRQYCVNKTVGNRKGWRLPTVDELATLYNTAGTGFGGGVPGSPFVNSTEGYWTSTVFLNDLGQTSSTVDGVTFAVAYIVSFTIGGNDGGFPQPTDGTFAAWCVRGSSAGNAQ